MKRLALVFLVLAIAVLIIFLLLRHKGAAPASGVATLLPADTTLLIHIPDVESNQEAWHRTNLYQLYREPAVQDFMRKPKAQLPQKSDLAEALRDSATLRIRDAFLATKSFDTLRLVGGFEFRCGEKEARSVIEQWKTRWLARGAQRSSVTYEKHIIETLTGQRLTLSSVMVGHRFLVATIADDLRALLDRLDGRSKGASLGSDQNFRAAMKQMPAQYAGLLYLQPKSLGQELVTLRAQSGRALPAGQQTLIEQMQSFSHATVFDGGKLRDIDFVAMPRLVDAKLTRDALGIASADTLLYLAMILNLRQQLAASSPPFSAAGITIDDWEAAFDHEISLLVEWPANDRMPVALATMTVRDSARAKKLVRTLATAYNWSSSPRGAAEFFVAPGTGSLPAMKAVAGLSEKRLAVALDIASVERAISPPANASSLASSATFRDVSQLVPEPPQQMFAWLDLGMVYSRLDATLRPLLQLSAALMPESASRFDLSKLPPAEAVTKHLSPIVASQVYINGGYRSESVGPVTLGQAAILGLGGYAGSMFWGKHGNISTGRKALPWVSAPSPSVTPATPAGSP
jgi:hypothetical protein